MIVNRRESVATCPTYARLVARDGTATGIPGLGITCSDCDRRAGAPGGDDEGGGDDRQPRGSGRRSGCAWRLSGATPESPARKSADPAPPPVERGSSSESRLPSLRGKRLPRHRARRAIPLRRVEASDLQWRYPTWSLVHRLRERMGVSRSSGFALRGRRGERRLSYGSEPRIMTISGEESRDWKEILVDWVGARWRWLIVAVVLLFAFNNLVGSVVGIMGLIAFTVSSVVF